MYNNSVLHLLKYTANLYLSRYSTDLQEILGHSVYRVAIVIRARSYAINLSLYILALKCIYRSVFTLPIHHSLASLALHVRCYPSLLCDITPEVDLDSHGFQSVIVDGRQLYRHGGDPADSRVGQLQGYCVQGTKRNLVSVFIVY